MPIFTYVVVVGSALIALLFVMALVAHLRRNYILATGLTYPVVPKGDEEIRFQMSADHTPDDIDTALDALGHFVGQ